MEEVNETKKRLEGLLDYVHHVGLLNQKPVFTISEYKQLNYSEHELKGKIGVHHDLIDEEGGSIWLKIERLQRIGPPAVPEKLVDWVTISNDPEVSPEVKDKIIRTLPESQALEYLKSGKVDEEDVRDPLKQYGDDVKRKDVIFRLEKEPELKQKVERYIQDRWFLWSEEEKPRRKTIKIYDALFSLQQAIEAQGEEQPLELVWGIGLTRWICEGHKIDYPLLEQLVEIEILNKDGSLNIRPRNITPVLDIRSYSALDNQGVEPLLRFSKKHFLELSEDVEFSPYFAESYEAILRQAATQLSESGTYWPDVNANRDNREPPATTAELQVTDCWAIYARPRSITSFVQDIERFQTKLVNTDIEQICSPAIRVVSELSNDKKLSGGLGNIGGSGESGSNTGQKNESKKTELYFPKEFNDAQVQIIERLEQNDGVVVQGPPGTGKTHTIANIISHYLATGRTVLVTSKGKPALDVLRDQIPEELRDLTISLLSNEREGFKQLESAVSVLANIASQTNLRDLNQNADALQQRVTQLKGTIAGIDKEIHEWGLKQLNTISTELTGNDDNITAMDLAKLVIDNKDKHEWFDDQLGPGTEYKPQFSDEDIADLREARRTLGKDIAYVGKRVPSISDMPDSAQIAAIHEDLVNASKLGDIATENNLPPMSLTAPDALTRAKELLPKIKNLISIINDLEQTPWLRNLFNHWVDKGLGHEKFLLLEEMLPTFKELVERRATFIKKPVNLSDPSQNKPVIIEALDNLANGKRPFGLLSLGKGELKVYLSQVEVHGENAETQEQWGHVRDYLQFQEDVRRFMVQWNSIGQEYDLPILEYQYGDLIKSLEDLHKRIKDVEILGIETWREIAKELKELFPHGLQVENIPNNSIEAKRALESIESHTSRIMMGSQRQRIVDLQNKLKYCTGKVVDKIQEVLNKGIGNPKYNSDQIIKCWGEICHEVTRLHQLEVKIITVDRVAQKVKESGAKKWANKLTHEPLLSDDDELTPSHWFESWRWARQAAYIKSIDGREKLSIISQQRTRLDKDLKKSFTELVKVKTQIGLHQTLTERVQGALMRFVSAVAKIGKGTGKRAPRHRREAYRAMSDCYDGVPCWIMPSWRISESLPSEFGNFDLVIIDEASQSDISVLPALLRAKKILIVGDDKQVSPTGAFIAEEKILQLKHNFLHDQPNAELLLPGSSIYDLANSIYPAQRIMLSEHFRCVEPIIRFSMQFYTEPLIPLRIPKGSERIDPPLVDVFVKSGIRDERKKINESEIEAIVSEIKKITKASQYRHRTIGVISLIGGQQAHAIQEALLAELGEDIYQNHQITCGDAAMFQGKEKDIIFLSMVVGPGQGVVMSKREYEQRFNVALSRARDRMYLFRSITESDLSNESDLRLRVLRHFQSPMPQMQQMDNPLDMCDSDFERDVYKRLTGMGYFVTPQVKVGQYSIDLVVDGENDRRLAIELDGDKYHPPEKWADDFQRQRTMERVGWRFWRCWGSSYTVDPDGCIADLVNTMRELGIEPVGNRQRSNIYTEYREYIPEIIPDIFEEFRL